MQSYEFEIMCRWVAARLRRKGYLVVERDPDFMDAVSELGLSSVADAVGLGNGALDALASRLRRGSARAA